VDPKVPHAHPLGWGRKYLKRSLHIRYCPKVGAFQKNKHPRCGLVIFKTT